MMDNSLTKIKNMNLTLESDTEKVTTSAPDGVVGRGDKR